MMLQSGVDAIGPGLANIVYNIQLESKSVTMNYLPLELMQLGQKVPLNVLPNFGRYDGYDACAWTYLREIFNEITTGICVCATGLYRYLLVCHPSYKVEDTFYKKGAFVIAAILILEIIAITADLAFNNTYEYIDFAIDANYRFQFHNTKTIHERLQLDFKRSATMWF